jgi:hypothetical protein
MFYPVTVLDFFVHLTYTVRVFETANQYIVSDYSETIQSLVVSSHKREQKCPECSVMKYRENVAKNEMTAVLHGNDEKCHQEILYFLTNRMANYIRYQDHQA